jgi:hypothetical protein
MNKEALVRCTAPKQNKVPDCIGLSKRCISLCGYADVIKVKDDEEIIIRKVYKEIK